MYRLSQRPIAPTRPGHFVARPPAHALSPCPWPWRAAGIIKHKRRTPFGTSNETRISHVLLLQQRAYLEIYPIPGVYARKSCLIRCGPRRVVKRAAHSSADPYEVWWHRTATALLARPVPRTTTIDLGGIGFSLAHRCTLPVLAFAMARAVHQRPRRVAWRLHRAPQAPRHCH